MKKIIGFMFMVFILSVIASFASADTFQIQLYPGNNYISFPLVPNTNNLTELLEPIAGKYTAWAKVDNGWLSSEDFFDPLLYLDEKHGYNIVMNESAVLEIEGEKITEPITFEFVEGWNMMGYPSMKAELVEDVLGDLNYSIVWASIEGEYRSHNSRLANFTTMEPGMGFLIYVNEDSELTFYPDAQECIDEDGVDYFLRSRVEIRNSPGAGYYNDECVVPSTEEDTGFYAAVGNQLFSVRDACNGDECYVAESVCDGDEQEFDVHLCEYGCDFGRCLGPQAFIAVGDDSPADDVILAAGLNTAITYYNVNNGIYERPIGPTKLFSEVDALDDLDDSEIVVAIYNGEAVIIESSKRAIEEELYEDIVDFLDDNEIEYIVIRSDEVDSSDLGDLFPIGVEECPDVTEEYCSGDKLCGYTTFFEYRDGACVSYGGTGWCRPCQFGCEQDACKLPPVVIEGDAYQISKSADKLNLYQNLNTVKETLTDDDLNALADGTLKGKTIESYTQTLKVATGASQVQWVKPSADYDNLDPELYLYFPSSSTVVDYKLNFGTGPASDIDYNGNLEDYENQKISILGKEYTILKAENLQSSARLSIMRGGIQDTLEVGQTKTYVLNGVEYEVTVLIVSGDTSVTAETKLIVNDEVTNLLGKGDTYRLKNGIDVGIKEVIPTHSSDVVQDLVEFYLGAEKLVLDGNDNTLDIGDKSDISDATVTISTTKTATEVKVNNIKINWSPGNGVYVAKGMTLSEALDTIYEEDEYVLFFEAFALDYLFGGTAQTNLEEVIIGKENDNSISLKFTNKNGIDYQFPAFYKEYSGAPLMLGKNSGEKLSVMQNSIVEDEGMFIVESDDISRVLQLKDIKNTSSTNEISLKDIGTGQIMDYSFDIGGYAGILLDGYEYEVKVLNESAILLTDITDDGSGNVNVSLFTRYGSSLNLGSFYDIVLTEDKDRQEDDWSIDSFAWNVTWDSVNNNIDLTPVIELAGTELSMQTLEGDFKVSEGYSKWGTFFKRDTNGDQDEWTITIPEDELEADVFVTMNEQEPVKPYCYDSDNGIDFFTKGYVDAYNYPSVQEDACCINCNTAPTHGGPYVREYFCSNVYEDVPMAEDDGIEEDIAVVEGILQIQSSESSSSSSSGGSGGSGGYSGPYGDYTITQCKWGCEEGRCLNSPKPIVVHEDVDTCTDNGEYIDYERKLSGGSMSKYACSDDTRIIEYYCGDEAVMMNISECQYGCYDGTCAPFEGAVIKKVKMHEGWNLLSLGNGIDHSYWNGFTDALKAAYIYDTENEVYLDLYGSEGNHYLEDAIDERGYVSIWVYLNENLEMYTTINTSKIQETVEELDFTFPQGWNFYTLLLQMNKQYDGGYFNIFEDESGQSQIVSDKIYIWDAYDQDWESVDYTEVTDSYDLDDEIVGYPILVKYKNDFSPVFEGITVPPFPEV